MKSLGLSRLEIINIIGELYLSSNIENGEYSYQQVIDRKIDGHYKLDIRFYDSTKKVAVLVETKRKIAKKDKSQLFAYVELEQELSSETNIVAILAGTDDAKIRVWKIVDGDEVELNDSKIKTYEDYVGYFKVKNVNDKSAVLENTTQLNRKLHDNGVPENLRSQFVGTCLLALKNGLKYEGLSTSQIIAGIKEILGNMLKDSVDKATKISILHTKVLQDSKVENLKSDSFQNLLSFIKKNIAPYIDESSNEGHDILSYFFTTFNKYVQKGDKNQAFTPNHIAHFMCKLGNITRQTRVLDPTCGSGTFLVQAMAQSLSKCETEEERRAVREEHIYGIEYDENVYGLSTTNMLIHGDGNSNIIAASCFEKEKWIKNSDIHLVLMNPPYNASKAQVEEKYAKTWGKTSTDPSKGFYFVKFVADCINKGRLITLLPLSCAIATNGVIAQFKRSMLDKHTLDAVFSFPTEMFYPGASAVACCMVFDLGKPHKDTDKETFFGYFKDDGFEKRKGVGRVDVNDRWESIEKLWLDLYEHRATKAGLSVTKKVTAIDEWCAEAYMETDYSVLIDSNFIKSLRDYAVFLIQNEIWNGIFERQALSNKPPLILNYKQWKYFSMPKLFPQLQKCKCSSATELLNDGFDIAYIGAKKNENGVMRYVQYEPDLETDGNCIVFIGDGQGSVGYCLYQPKNFIGSTTLIAGYNDYLNVYTALFLVTVLDLERYRYSFGRKYNKNAIEKSKIKLPVDANGNPDWQFMEYYIKSLPYSKNIEQLK